MSTGFKSENDSENKTNFVRAIGTIGTTIVAFIMSDLAQAGLTAHELLQESKRGSEGCRFFCLYHEREYDPISAK